ALPRARGGPPPHRGARVVVAHAADQPDLGPEAPRGHRLVGPLAAAVDQQGARGDGLPDAGQPGQRDGVVEVGRADYADAGHRRSRKSRSTASESTFIATRQPGTRLRWAGSARRSVTERPRVSLHSHSTSTLIASKVTSAGS